MGIIGTLVYWWLLFLETRQYFGTSQNRIDDKKSGTEGVWFLSEICGILLY